IFWHLPSVSLRCFSRRSYWGENTGSHSNSEVKHSKAGLVLGWGTAWEPHGNDGFFFCRAQQIFLENVRDVPVRIAKLSTRMAACCFGVRSRVSVRTFGTFLFE